MARVLPSILLLVVGLVLSGCTGLPDSLLRKWSNVTPRQVLEEADLGFVEAGYKIGERDYEAGRITARSPTTTRKLLGIFPWRYEEWDIQLDVTLVASSPPLSDEATERPRPAIVVLTGNVDIFERGTFPGSEWRSRSERAGDRQLVLELLKWLDDRMDRIGAIRE